MENENRGWKEVRLGDVVEVQAGYAFKSNDFIENGKIPVVKIKNIVPPIIDVNMKDTQCISEELAEEKSKYQLNYNDILISMTGSNVNQFESAVGKIGRVRLKNKKVMLNQRVGRLILKDESIADYDFIYYYIARDEIRYELASSAGGSANQANISPNQIKDLILNIPPLPEQKRIAEILSSLDDKIELNNQMNKTLEEMAQAIFKQWFVEFEFSNENGEPYKSSGGEMEESELGLIPKGWRVGKLGEVCDEITERIKKLEARVLSAVKTGELVLSEEYFTKQVYSKSIEKYKKVEKYSFAYNPARVNIGSIGLHKEDFLGAVSPVYVAFKVEEAYHWFFEFLIRQKRIQDEIAHRGFGSVRQALNFEDFGLIKIVYPNKSVILEFNKMYEEFIKKIEFIKKQTEMLTQIRNTLLPKLMSGEIDLKEVEI